MTEKLLNFRERTPNALTARLSISLIPFFFFFFLPLSHYVGSVQHVFIMCWRFGIYFYDRPPALRQPSLKLEWMLTTVNASLYASKTFRILPRIPRLVWVDIGLRGGRGYKRWAQTQPQAAAQRWGEPVQFTAGKHFWSVKQYWWNLQMG
jgi:hypothetical protein